jgi:hypothetical protein
MGPGAAMVSRWRVVSGPDGDDGGAALLGKQTLVGGTRNV